MLFEVIRTSGCASEEKPFEECKPIKLLVVDSRTFKTPEEYDKRFGKFEKWLDKGTNHRIEDGHIVRDLGETTVWGIEIGSLEELVSV